MAQFKLLALVYLIYSITLCTALGFDIEEIKHIVKAMRAQAKDLELVNKDHGAMFKDLEIHDDDERILTKAYDLYELENMTTPETIEAQGYVAETHYVTTEDGYILAMHRIPYGINDSSVQPRPAILLQHGLLSSSYDFVDDMADRAFGYLLADAGYDVWINNNRGNTYSRNHTTLDPDVDKRQFWEFTIDQLGYYDVPAAIDYILSTTGNTQVYYAGESLGSTLFFALLSRRPEYADKVKVAALLAPVVYMQNVQGTMRSFANISEELTVFLTLKGHYEVFASTEVEYNLANNYCLEGMPTAPQCYEVFYNIGGRNPSELNTAAFPVHLTHYPAGTSVHLLNHFEQLIFSDEFRMYNWGKIGNQQHYGQDSPPVYNLTEPTPPVGLFWGQNDYVADPQDVARLASELKNVTLNYRVAMDTWSHFDFPWGIHAREYVHDQVLAFLAQY